INYVKQKTISSVGTRPDFTFNLPHGLKVNMDVKFPLDNYMRYLETESATDRERFKNAFLSDVKNQSNELAGREYINPEQKTLDYVLMFIPNEQVYAFIQEQDSSIMDQALAKRVIFCSPLTLFAILAVIRQAVDNFALEQTSNEMLTLLGQFYKQWELFKDSLEKMGSRIAGAQEEFERLSTTRTRQLEKPLEKLEQLRSERELPAETDSSEPKELAGREGGQ
ncbi:MAG: DNA recombination protein RmuC, partial [Phycisphaerae bacterium]|nr:DNA recombination protein RmuC [Phycisphaerae bacterium]